MKEVRQQVSLDLPFAQHRGRPLDELRLASIAQPCNRRNPVLRRWRFAKDGECCLILSLTAVLHSRCNNEHGEVGCEGVCIACEKTTKRLLHPAKEAGK